MTTITLRDVSRADLDTLFEFGRDPTAVQMAAFTHKDPSDRAAFEAHWTKLLADASVLKRVVLADGVVVGSIVSWGPPEEREITYWIDRAQWGKGIATKALAAFLREETTRPLVGRTAKDNDGSRRVLEKCGFRLVEESRWFANARGAEIEELVLRIDAAPAPDGKRELLRHLLATIAYRGSRALRGAPSSFAQFKTGEPSRPAVDVVAHMGDLFDWSVAMSAGDGAWRTATPLAWDAECARFFASLKRLDDLLASDTPLKAPLERLVQGPVGDALTHVGQLAMMRRMAGSPAGNENYFAADVRIGRVGPEQAQPVRAF